MICLRNLVKPLWAPDFNNSLTVSNFDDSVVLAIKYLVGISFFSISVGKYDEKKGHLCHDPDVLYLIFFFTNC